MQTSDIIEAIDKEIDKLRQARALLAGAQASEKSARVDTRPKTSAKLKKIEKPKRSMSAGGKARIAAAQKARWAAQRKVQKPTKKPVFVAGTNAPKTSVKKTAKTGPSKTKTGPSKTKTAPIKTKLAGETPTPSPPRESEAVAI